MGKKHSFVEGCVYKGTIEFDKNKIIRGDRNQIIGLRWEEEKTRQRKLLMLARGDLWEGLMKERGVKTFPAEGQRGHTRKDRAMVPWSFSGSFIIVRP